MNGAYQIINFDDIEFTTGTAELVVGAYKKITDTAKRFVITHLNLDNEVYKDIQLTFENVEGTFIGTGVVNGKLAGVSIASNDQVTVSLNDITGGITALQNALAVTDAKFNYSTTEQVVGTWVDGRPVYRKTKVLNYSDGTFLPNTDVTINMFTGNEYIIDSKAALKYTRNGTITQFVQFPLVYDSTKMDLWFLRLSNIDPINDRVVFGFGTSWLTTEFTNLEILLTFEYTKTTDTPPTP